MGRALHLALILVLAFTGLSLGAARGQTQIAGQVVLCAGGAITVQLVDRDGQPVERVQICPDMALSLLSALDSPPMLPHVDAPAVRFVPAVSPQVAEGRGLRLRQGRGPPAERVRNRT
ncbi:MAG TPA: hypothetical protein PLL33_15505 [Paracoccus sp. (in: a-proteobacteria)]|nr:hypothetical protein [Paracoccus sp. (in: a-proteobacteria)]